MKSALELQQENKRLQCEIAVEKAKLVERDSHIAILNERIKYLLQQRFAPSSEKTSADQLGLFNEAEGTCEETIDTDTVVTTEIKSHSRTRKPRVSIPAALPRHDIIYDLAESEKTCPHDGSPLKLIGSDDHEQLEIIPAKINVICHKRLKYACDVHGCTSAVQAGA